MSTKKEIEKEDIEKVVEKTFMTIGNVYHSLKDKQSDNNSNNFNSCESHIIFPKYSNKYRKVKGTLRISEQELRFIFVEQLNKYANENNIDLYYSVETPTEEPYNFTEDTPKLSEEGVSARTDLSIYDNQLKRICLIEFKALNPVEKSYEKDILKLIRESADLKYFIQIIKNYNNRTKESLNNKTKKMKGEGINYMCYCLEKGEEVKLKWQE